MKVTVDLSEKNIGEIQNITGIRKKGPAIRRLIEDSLQAQRRALIADRFLTGEWSADLEGFEAAKAADRAESKTLSEQWRD